MSTQSEDPAVTNHHPQETSATRQKTPIVGIVGAAGSRQALEMLFRNLPAESGIAFVVVTRMGRKQIQQLPALLQQRSDMPVVMATDGVEPEADHIYVVPADVQPFVGEYGLALHAQRSKKYKEEEKREQNGPLDTFLESLATTYKGEACALLLSGTGTDGVAGLRAVAEAGGTVLIHEPNEAAHGTLPRRARDSCPDALVAVIGDLARKLVQLKGDLADRPLPAPVDSIDSFGELYATILTQIAKHTGHDLSHYKASTLHRRVARRMGVLGIPSLTQYVDRLEDDADETLVLFLDSLVSVTNFFRDPDAYEMLERDCIPQLFAEKIGSEQVRVWVVGCATGQEAYSIAMQLVEYAAQIGEPPRLQIFATDLDEEAIAFARRGVYPKSVANEMSSERLGRFFTEEDGGYRVKPEIREHVLFAVHDLLKDPPFSQLDLISCRNVLIYFNREAQAKVFAIFHYALNRNRAGREYLFLGTSESVDAAPDLFDVLDKYCHLYQRRDVVLTERHHRPWTPLTTEKGGTFAKTAPIADTSSLSMEELYTKWSLRMHTSPRLLVNANYEITHLFGDVSPYLQNPEGAVTQDVLQRILPDLRLDLRPALYQAFSKGERSISRALRVEIDRFAHLIHLHVGPIDEPGFPEGYAEVVFVASDGVDLLEHSSAGEVVETDRVLVVRMEEELMRLRERLQSIVLEHEESSHELRTSNEELQSINEELMSTMEELETNKEELQSMNEELVTVNGELTEKVSELDRAYSDLGNFIASTEVGAIFLGKDLRISRFTPRAADLFNLIEADHGRPLSHVTHRIRHTGLPALASHVLENQRHIEETVQRDDDRWYMLRLFPYRTINGEFEGIVITFVDINDLKRAESEERQRVQQQTLVALGRIALEDNSLDDLFLMATRQVATVLEMEFCKMLNLQPDGKTLLLQAGIGWQEGLVGTATIPTGTESQAGYTLQANGPVVVRDIETETRFQGSDLLNAHGVRSGMSVTIYGPNGPYGVLGVHDQEPRSFAPHDVDFLQATANILAAAIVRRQAETALRASEERLRLGIIVGGLAIGEVDYRSDTVDLSPDAAKLFGLDAEVGSITRAEFYGLVHPDDRTEVLERIEESLNPVSKGWFAVEIRIITPAGDLHWLNVRKQIFFAPDGSGQLQPQHALLVARDITERKQAEERLRFLVDASRILTESLDYNVTLQNVAYAVVAEMADWCAVDLLNAAGSIDNVAVAHHDPAKVRWADEIVGRNYPLDPEHPTGSPRVIRRGQPEHYPEITDAMLQEAAQTEDELALLRSVGYRSVIIVPLRIQERVLGAITLVTAESERQYTEADLVMAEELATRAAAAIENAQLYAEVQQHEAELRQSEAQFRAVQQTTPDGFMIFESVREESGLIIDFRWLYTNPAAEKIVGRSHEDLLGKRLLEEMPGNRETGLFDAYVSVVESGKVWQQEFAYTFDGLDHWFRSTAARTGDGFAVAFANISARKAAEAQLRASEERFRSAFDQAAVGMAHLDLEGRYVRVNNRLCEILGYPRADLLQKTFMEITHPDDLATDLEAMKQQIRREIDHHSMEKRYLRKDGSYIWANMTAAVIYDDEDTAQYGIVVIQDISARKEAELALQELNATLERRVATRTAELEQTNRDLDQFAYVASHDLKAPLRAIDHLAGWIAEDAGEVLPPPSQEHLHKLRSRVQRMETLLEDLLAYSRAGRIRGDAAPTALGELVDNVMELMSPPSGFTLTRGSEMPIITTYRTPLELVLRNLIGNAIKHHQSETGWVHIGAVERGDFVEISVQDDGPGIAPEFRQQIFEMFRTLAPRDEVEGSGIGLAVVKKTVESLGGKVWIDSATGEGATFTFTWPQSI